MLLPFEAEHGTREHDTNEQWLHHLKGLASAHLECAVHEPPLLEPPLRCLHHHPTK